MKHTDDIEFHEQCIKAKQALDAFQRKPSRENLERYKEANEKVDALLDQMNALDSSKAR